MFLERIFVEMKGSEKGRDKIVLGHKEKKVRNIVGGICAAAVCAVIILNVFMGFGKTVRPVIYGYENEIYSYNINNGENVIAQEYLKTFKGLINFDDVKAEKIKYETGKDVFYYGNKTGQNGWEVHFSDGKRDYVLKDNIKYMRFAQNGEDVVLFEENGDTCRAYFFRNGNCDFEIESCFDATVIGDGKSEYIIYEAADESGGTKTMFSNFKDQPFELGVKGFAPESAMMSPDSRKFMVIAGENRSLYVFNINNVNKSTEGGISVGENVETASFTGLKNDFGFIDSNGDFYYSSGGYTFKEDENINKAEFAFDTLTVFYVKDDGSLIRFYVGGKTPVASGIKDICYIGSNNLACITDDGKLGIVKNDDFEKLNIDAGSFMPY